MADYFSKLGSLLSQVLEAGELPSASADNKADTGAEKAAAPDSAFSVHAAPDHAAAMRATPKTLTKTEQEAFKTLSIPEQAGFDEARAIYRAKLKRFHPDMQGDNSVLQTVARKKTAQCIAAWQTVKRAFER